MKKGTNKKKLYLCLGGFVLYAILARVLVGNRDRFTRPVTEEYVVNETEVTSVPLIDPERQFDVFDNTVEYAAPGQGGRYVASEEILVRDTDKEDILNRFALPSLGRMAEEDSAKMTKNLQALKRVEVLGIDTKELFTPE